MSPLSEIPYHKDNLEILIDGSWVKSESNDGQLVVNPGTGKKISRVPFALHEEIDAAVASADSAFKKWNQIPLSERAQYLFKMKAFFEQHFESLARINTQNHGKTILESRGDIRRTIDNIEAAIAASYTLLKGEHLDQISEGIDEGTIKEPLGVFGIVCPFNFPIMVPFWFVPYAIVAGCTVVVKLSEVTPLPMTWLAQQMQKEINLPQGVLNLVHGSKDAVEALVSNPLVKGVTFVGSTPVGRDVYRLAGEYEKEQ